MKKTVLVSLTAMLVATSANAGWLDALGFGKKAEPATLEEACDTAEIKKICPEVVLGTKTMAECLSENVTSLSTKCATFVKKSIVSKKEAAVETVQAVKTGLNDKAAESKAEKDTRGAEAKEAVAAKVDAVKAGVAAKKAAVQEKVAAEKEARAEQKAAAKATGQGIADAVRETGDAAKETGKAFKEIF